MEESGEHLGKATLDLEANLGEFLRNMQAAHGGAGRVEHALDAVAAVSNIATAALNRVKASPGQAAESKSVLEVIERSVGRVNRTALDAADHLDRVKLTAAQASETEASGSLINRVLRKITGNANEARRAIESVKLTGGVPGRSGVGVGPFGSGFGRVGLLGAGIGAGVLTAPAAGPAAIGLLASIPTLAAGGAGALGTLALAFAGVGKAIGGDLKAFKALEPAQQQFVQTVRSLIPWINRLKQTAGGNLFPGLTQGLHSALTPGTVGAITKAVAGFARAIGQAGAAWGKYFGSTQFQQIFGPLMAAGAHNLAVLSDAALHLFDALGVLGRAAIPLTSWLTVAADKGAKLADAWLRSQDASGKLGKAMTEAQSSLRLVGGLLVAIGRAVVALGVALYPVAKIAVKDLTDGFTALAGIITRNQSVIREVVGGALNGLVGAVKLAANGIRDFNHGLELFLGKKASVITAIALIGTALALTMGPQSAAIVGAVIGIGLIAQHWSQISKFMVGATAAAWKAIKGTFDLGVYGALFELALIAKGVEKAFGWLPIIGPKIKAAFGAVDGWIEGFRQRGVAELGNAGAQMGAAWGSAFGAQTLSNLKKVSGALDEWAAGHHKKALNDLAAQGFTTDLLTGKPIPAAVPQSAVPSIDFTVPGSSSTGSPFGTPPPFTKNVPTGKKPAKPSVIPPLAAHAEALARANASRASVLHNVGQTAKRYLEAELADLNVADKAIKEKLSTATGKVRTQLFAALTSVENKMRSVRLQIRKAIVDNRAAELALAVEVAKNAVASAQEGTAAYDKAVAAEAKALKAEIAYLEARGKNLKLSIGERMKAIRSEIADKKALAALLKQDKAANAGADQSQFLTAFANIVQSYAPNAFPQGKPAPTKTDTHLHNLVNETREQTKRLDKIAGRSSFPFSGYMSDSAAAVFG